MLALLKKHPAICFIVALITGLLIWGFWPQPIMVEGIAARYAPMTVSIEEEGRTRLIDRYLISASVDGVTCRQQLKVGDTVKQGQVLLGITPLQSQVLDPRSRAQAQAQVAAAKSALHAAQEQANAASASAQLASNELTRLQSLMAQALISREAFDKAQTQAQTTAAAKRSANFSVEVAKYELEAAATALQYSAAADSGEPVERVNVRSPIDGKILKVVRECEGPVRTGEPLLEVGNPSALEIEVDVLSADAVKIKPGMKVLFDRWGGDKPLEGQVRIVEPVGFTKASALGVEEQRVLIISDFVSEAQLWNQLGDGYRVEANFILWQQENVLQIPASSLFRYKGGWAVFVIERDLAVRREVKVGQRNGLIAQILEGVNDGELVINHPSDEVDDGKRVKVRSFE
ncbi:HlyD family efflux transporter periplasmic adaptor subunit [Colwellia sp. MB02u-18]|uniref:efflux RND transporter periplasmic adaptor subunit n=1 Tax=unclassified Colwellia TaxID=196834 RepID=UPI0015F55721|nr:MULTISPECIES: HlyD family efflux transporter periplasmic adaptor subunit [unclassified Colwellia]MBA6224700.1 HlyD family efflux transporter periplasmic adaptor subunit [Colwellia sp. MB3u-45]MBA6266713.1 HlyD family efflux transporter periplasmic adaptor subunit [Colwellia sp. MB3u-43]MBA6319731.1 HlyD family efflux transporter periplasmic adaptor subunit [Colwellia sp. MB02u-19]MBA6325440.1 HlyD family efflux transporter periplasmic adaptor subunit [Colwellia sp. MB02u-18]MBA6330152.1 Hly